MEYKTIDELKSYGFIGFRKINDLFIDCSDIPNERGNYLVVYSGRGYPEFISKGVGGRYKGKDPNVSIKELELNWVNDTAVLYIAQVGGIQAGKWSNQILNDRIKTYMIFGKGKSVPHWGGRYIWQIKQYKELVLCWKPLPNKIADPRLVEGKLIQNFKSIYGKNHLLIFEIKYCGRTHYLDI